jgi:hypothetical protein
MATASETSPPADIETLRQLVLTLQREVREARATQPQTQTTQPVAHSMDASKLGRKPDPFNGSRKSRAVQSWIKSIDDYFELNPGQHSTPRRGVLTAASYLIDPAKADYNTYVESKGEFETWTDMKKWLNDTYNPVDPINTSRKNFFSCKQGPDESPDSYHRRFLDCKNLLDTPFDETYVVYFFVHGLIRHYKEQILADNDFAKWDKSLDEVVSKIKRGPPPPTTSQGQSLSMRISNGGSSLNERISSDRPNKKQKTSNTSSNNKSSGGGNTTTSSSNSKYDETPLTENQRRFLDQNIQKGGGIILFDSVQNKVEWIKEARQRNLCINCAGPGHNKSQCTATKRSLSELNAILPGFGDLNAESQV